MISIIIFAMKNILQLCILMVSMSIASVYALERSAALPYNYSNSVNKVFVPNCSPTQDVAVSGTYFVCRDIPTCPDNQMLYMNAGTWACKALPSAVPAGSLCGIFRPAYVRGTPYYYIDVECSGITREERYGVQYLRSCPEGYALAAVGGDMVKRAYNNASDSDDWRTNYEVNTYSCIKR